MQLDTIKRSKSDNEEITQRYESFKSSLQKENNLIIVEKNKAIDECRQYDLLFVNERFFFVY